MSNQLKYSPIFKGKLKELKNSLSQKEFQNILKKLENIIDNLKKEDNLKYKKLEYSKFPLKGKLSDYYQIHLSNDVLDDSKIILLYKINKNNDTLILIIIGKSGDILNEIGFQNKVS